MSINCACCKELIEDEPIRKGRYYFCSYECLEDFERRDEEGDDRNDRHREREEF